MKNKNQAITAFWPVLDHICSCRSGMSITEGSKWRKKVDRVSCAARIEHVWGRRPRQKKNMWINDGQINYLKVSSPELWSPKRKESLMVSHINSSGCTPRVSLTFLCSVEHQLHQVWFRATKSGGKNGEELEKGVPASQWPGRWLLLAELRHLHHKGTAKHIRQHAHGKAALDMQKQHLQGQWSTREEGGVAPHWGHHTGRTFSLRTTSYCRSS